MQAVLSATKAKTVICPMLNGKSAVVTGSTSGIGLGIARAFASAGMNVMLNGFGDTADIDRQRNAIERDFERPFRAPICRSLMRS